MICESDFAEVLFSEMMLSDGNGSFANGVGSEVFPGVSTGATFESVLTCFSEA
jgi:hypothetical protein